MIQNWINAVLGQAKHVFDSPRSAKTEASRQDAKRKQSNDPSGGSESDGGSKSLIDDVDSLVEGNEPLVDGPELLAE